MSFRFQANEWAPVGAPHYIKLYRIPYRKIKRRRRILRGQIPPWLHNLYGSLVRLYTFTASSHQNACAVLQGDSDRIIDPVLDPENSDLGIQFLM